MVKKMRRQRSRKRQTYPVETILQVVEDQNIYTKGEQRKRYVHREMKKMKYKETEMRY